MITLPAAGAEAGHVPLERTFRRIEQNSVEQADNDEVFRSYPWAGGLGWSDILTARRVLMIAPAGVGKTHECTGRARALRAEGKVAFDISLEELSRAGLDGCLSARQRRDLNAWRADGSSPAWFFLDSVDELELSQGRFHLALRAFSTALEGHLHRAHVIVTSRPVAADEVVMRNELPEPHPHVEREPRLDGEARFRDHMSRERKEADQAAPDGTSPLIVVMDSLTGAQVQSFIAAQDIADGPALLQAIAQKGMFDFATRPQELLEICDHWRQHGRLGRRAEQLDAHIRKRLREPEEARARALVVSDQLAWQGAARLALALLVTRKRTIQFRGAVQVGSDQEPALDPSVILPDWTSAQRQELLRRPLFGPAGYGCVRFHHRSVSEFLAAWQLDAMERVGHLSQRSLFRLLFRDVYGRRTLAPALRPAIGWLALRRDAVADEVLRLAPEALLEDGDPESFPLDSRRRIVSSFVDRYRHDLWRGIRVPVDQVLRLADPDLSSTVRLEWTKGAAGVEARELLVGLVRDGRMADCLDIAEQVARDQTEEGHIRIDAVGALTQMKEPGTLDWLVTDILCQPDRWPAHVKKHLLSDLFPRHMSVTQLVALLRQLEGLQRTGLDPAFQLEELVRQLPADLPSRRQLRQELAGLIRSAIALSEDLNYSQSRFSNYVPALAQLCLAELKIGATASPDLVDDCVLAMRCHDREFGRRDSIEPLRITCQSGNFVSRKDLFVAHGRFCLRHGPVGQNPDTCLLRWLLVEELSGLRPDDLPWLFELVRLPTQPMPMRSVVFEALMLMDPVPSDDHAVAVAAVANLNPAWCDRLREFLAPRMPDPQMEATRLRIQEGRRRRLDKEAARLDDWSALRNEVLADPDGWFAKTPLETIVSNFHEVLANSPRGTQFRVYWDGDLITELYSKDVANRARSAFLRYWRTIEVPLESEQPPEGRGNRTWPQFHAFTGLDAETESPAWAARLTADEASLAARLAMLVHGAFPPWFGDLQAAHPQAVDQTLGAELSAQLSEAGSYHDISVLWHVEGAGSNIQATFRPRILNWLVTAPLDEASQEQLPRIRNHLERAFKIILASPERGGRPLLRRVWQEVRRSLESPLAVDWLCALFRLHPRLSIRSLDRQLPRLSTDRHEAIGLDFFASLGGHTGRRLAPDLSDSRLTPDDLMRLVLLAYTCVRPDEDIKRPSGEVYSPTRRDDAESGRSAVLKAFLNSSGPAAWDAKQRLRKHPLFARLRDRIDQLAGEQAARDAEGPALSDSEAAAFLGTGEPPALDRDGLFQLTLDRLDEIARDIAHHDFSERDILKVIDHETSMQRWFASRLQDRARGLYTVDREGEVADNKRTDIRLTAKLIDRPVRAVIEVKLANKGWTLHDLQDALKTQLLGQYMRHDSCCAGVLLITLNKTKRWRRVDGSYMRFSDLIGHLSDFARELERDHQHAVRLEVVGIDLTAPNRCNLCFQ